jgi:hypothetical protein
MADKVEEQKLTPKIPDDYLCPRCEIPGHLEEDCDVPSTIFSVGAEKRAITCAMCGKKGHDEKNCMQRMKTVIRVKHSHNRDIE